MWHHRTGCLHPNYPTEKLDEVAAILSQMFLKDHERLLTMYRNRAFRFVAGWLCWEYTIGTDILKHSLYDLSPPDEAAVQMWVPCVGRVDAGRVLALVFNFGGGRGKGRAQMQLVALRKLVEGNSFMFVMVLIFVILTVLVPAAVVLWISAMVFTFKFHKLVAAFQGSWQLLHGHWLAVASCLNLPYFVATTFVLWCCPVFVAAEVLLEVLDNMIIRPESSVVISWYSSFLIYVQSNLWPLSYHQQSGAEVVFLLFPLVVAGLRVRYYSEDLRKLDLLEVFRGMSTIFQ